MRQLRYSMFELLVLTFGAGTVFVLILTSPWQTPVEIVGLLLLIPILVSVLHYGRNGGLVTFFLASIVYLALNVPYILKIGPVNSILQLLVVRILVYGVVGIGGGILCTRIKYLFAKLEQLDFIDNVTTLYNPGYLGQLIGRYVEEFERYQHFFSVATLKIESRAFDDLKAARIRRKLRAIGLSIRNDIRAVDEVGRINQNEFGLIFPNTDVSGATAVGERLQKLVENHLRMKRHSIEDEVKIKVEILGYPEDEERIEKLLQRLGGQDLPKSKKSQLTTHR